MKTSTSTLAILVLASSCIINSVSAFVAPEKAFDKDFMLNKPQLTGPGGGLKFSVGDNDMPTSLGGGAKGNWPDINGVGMSTVAFRLEKCGAVAPHVHAGATEFQTVVKGQGIIGTYGVGDNKLTLQHVVVGNTFFFPSGSLHFQINSGTGPFVSVGAFDASQPTAALVIGYVDQLGDAGKALGLDTDSSKDTEGLDGVFPQFTMSNCADIVESLMGMM
ncbi:hypothetical protein SARC_11697 [Sphaeroforma arctica JP610]|uniref:Cupin type-1 domain-containing protein n=1 Tax=Sphaeroforma arctica JP610 TaxID=667725 RepID=A0A0L0FG77_9EUKA|nr:hypothetical protein SARC_11697 [Sphaeroforma arctica JP610]KNC75782.1 hypothetical protein SARC_11697 [Sphaeroforma arctica JP610]|eukprot:XP_014149684.1 hypothetical protein SARC_11697 [Sphaeroforma arctica JP610]